MHETFPEAFQRKTQLKKWRRLWKIRLIAQMNPQWNDVFDEFCGSLDQGAGAPKLCNSQASLMCGMLGRPPARA